MTRPLESEVERRARVVRDADAIRLRSRAAQGLPATVEDPVALAKIAVLVESPVRSQQVAR